MSYGVTSCDVMVWRNQWCTIPIPESESIPEWIQFWLESESESESNISSSDWNRNRNRNQTFRKILESESESESESDISTSIPTLELR